MRSGDRGWEVSRNGDPGTWRVGAAVDGGWVKKPGSWGTPFSCFRFAVPEVCNFEGRAIYLDADMLLLGDIAELWDMAPSKGFGMRAISPMRTDVSVIDCEYFNNPWWPTITQMRESGGIVYNYLQILAHRNALEANMPNVWNDCDGAIYRTHPETVKLLHFTNVLCGQPYRPYPNVDYSRFEWPFVDGDRCSVDAAKLWWRVYQEALIDQHPDEDVAKQQIALQGGVWQ